MEKNLVPDRNAITQIKLAEDSISEAGDLISGVVIPSTQTGNRRQLQIHQEKFRGCGLLPKMLRTPTTLSVYVKTGC